MKSMILTVVLLGVAAGAPVAADLTTGGDFPVVGKSDNVSLTGVGDASDLTLWVVYSPTSETQTEEEIGRFPADGRIAWEPSRFGIATLSARGDDGGVVVGENVAILFAATPVAGVMVMLFAGVLLFGGAVISMWSVLRSGVVD
jgi:hypothetical protein